MQCQHVCLLQRPCCTAFEDSHACIIGFCVSVCSGLCSSLALLTVVLQRVLDIKFVPAVLDNIQKMEVQGATFEGEKNYVNSKE